MQTRVSGYSYSLSNGEAFRPDQAKAGTRGWSTIKRTKAEKALSPGKAMKHLRVFHSVFQQASAPLNYELVAIPPTGISTGKECGGKGGK